MYANLFRDKIIVIVGGLSRRYKLQCNYIVLYKPDTFTYDYTSKLTL